MEFRIPTASNKNFHKKEQMIEYFKNKHSEINKTHSRLLNGVLEDTLDQETLKYMLDMYKLFEENNDIVYRFLSDRSKPVDKNFVRLINASGEWRLSPQGNGIIEVSYTWNGELLGDFPDWALTRAWKTQGDEVLNWIQEAAQE